MITDGARRLILLLAGLLGAAGIALAALSSHAGDQHLLGPASLISLVHAPALLALFAAYERIRTATFAAALIGLGSLLFVGDLMMRHFAEHSLFPMAAPAGGMTLIAGWLCIALGAAISPRR